jgi:hypothetical protein
MRYVLILHIEKTTRGFYQEVFLAIKRDLAQIRDRLRQIDQEYGATSNRIENAKQQLEKNRVVLDELHQIRKYVLELENIQKNVYSIDGPVAKSLRSWAFEIISEKASEYLEKLNPPIQRISLSKTSRDVNMPCYSTDCHVRIGIT